ncbi:sugar transferase [Winogradskyella sp. A2]|uniref:sugar transferase n=1 Tax=Winogradskyella sp. A2 TaxID=3366944 RepID=UPI00398C4FA3
MKIYANFIKRLLDFFIALFGIILASPLIIVLILLLSIYNNGKPFFYQNRAGKNAHDFTIIKFKSMNDKKDKDGNLLPDEVRLTPIGNFCRKYSLDELPQLFNIIKGDMSLIGPRPLPQRYVPYYNEEQRKRLNVLPGITGLAQINGRNSISWEERFEHDVYYVKNQSFRFDLKIFILTILHVLKRKDVNTEDGKQMPGFFGTKK